MEVEKGKKKKSGLNINYYYIVFILGFLFILFALLLANDYIINGFFSTTRSDYIDSYCDHGDYCPFCDDDEKCICSKGWYGTRCEIKRAIENVYDGPFFNWESKEKIYKGQLSYEECKAASDNDIDAKGFSFDPCSKPHVDDECTYQCLHIKTFKSFMKPFIVLGYETKKNGIEMPVTLPPQESKRREIFIDPTISQSWMFLKKGIECIGYLCTYNEKYGSVWVDGLLYENTNAHLDDIMFDQTLNWTDNIKWYDDLVNKFDGYNKLPSDLGDILEVTEMPFYQVVRVLNNTRFKYKSVTISSGRANTYKTKGDTDTYANKYNYELDPRELSTFKYSRKYQTKKYDTIFLTLALYGRLSLSRLLSNVYNLLNLGGHIIIVDHSWNYINSTVLNNWCMGAGMAKNKYLSNYRSLYTQEYLLEGPIIDHPCNRTDLEIPFPYKGCQCWGWNEAFLLPGHKTNWFYYIGKK